MEGTDTGHEDAEGMASVGVRLTAELGHGGCAKRPCPSSVVELPLPERWRAPMGGQLCIARSSSVSLEYPQKAGKLRVDFTALLGAEFWALVLRFIAGYDFFARTLEHMNILAFNLVR